MPNLVILEMDLASTAASKAKNITIPKMMASVFFENPPSELVEAVKKDKLILQKLIPAAQASLLKSRDTVGKALLDFDKNFKKSDEKSMKIAIAQFESVCRQVVLAQQGVAQAAVQAEWDKFAAKAAAYKTMKIKFGAKIIFASLGLAAAIVSAAVSGGTTVAAVVGMAKKVADIASEINEFSKSVTTTETEIVKMADELRKRYAEAKVNWKGTAKEIAAVLGKPAAATTAKLEDALKRHLAKSGGLDADADKAFTQAKAIIAKIPELEKAGKDKVKVKALGDTCDKLFEKIVALHQAGDAADKFQANYEEICKQVKAMKNPKLGTGLDVVKGISDYGSTVLSAAKEVMSHASSLV